MQMRATIMEKSNKHISTNSAANYVNEASSTLIPQMNAYIKLRTYWRTKYLSWKFASRFLGVIALCMFFPHRHGRITLANDQS